ncbi:MAG TPA: MFS transporter [Bryobacteraceae bacterium]|jgi:ACS family hexuronate transporter-like MFS transporter|nr:MFS transporter [Bryobacteraceae bacterium]
MTDPPSAGGAKLSFSRQQWFLAFLLFLMMVMNYLDRQALSVVAPVMRKDLGISVMGYANAVNSFLLAYSIMYAGSGMILDRIGYRAGLAIFVGLWSLFSGLHGAISGYASLLVFRFLLGLAEPGGFTGAVKTIAENYGPSQRALASSALGLGTGLGSLIAPPLIVFLSLRFGWRSAFIIASSVGVIWIPLWLWVTRRRNAAADPPVPLVKKLRSIPRNRKVLAYILARAFGDSSGYFVLFWFPEYLVTAKHFSFVMLGKLGWIPPCGSDIGAVLGGYLSSRLVARGWSPLLSRKILMSSAAVLLAAGVMLQFLSGPIAVLLSLSLCTIGVGIWACNLHALATDAFPRSIVATVHGTAGSAGAAAGIVFNSLVGYFGSRHNYGAALTMFALLLPMAVTPLWLWLNTPMDTEE